MPITSDFRGKKLLKAITDLMDNMESRYRSVFLKTIEDITNSPDIAEIVRDIRLGNITTIDASTLARIQGIKLNTYDLTVASRQAMASGGKITAKTVGLEGKFNLQNPRAIEAARTLSDELVSTLSKTVTNNLTDIITDAVSGTDSLSETIRRIKDEIGLTAQHSAAVKNYRKNLIQTGMNKGKALLQSERYSKRLLRYRAETIARTEVAIAVNKGQAEFWKQMKEDGSVPPTAMRVWIAEMDNKTCEICSPLNGELAPIDGGWSTTSGYFDIPHAHPRCRCTSGLVFPNKITKNDPTGYEQWILSKGEGAGHPFRGNQWTKVGSAGAGSKNEANASQIDWNVLYDNDVPGELESYLGDNAVKSLENWIFNAKYPTQWLKEVAGEDYQYEEHYQTLQGWLKEAKFPETVTVIRQGTPDSRGDIRSGSAIEGWTGGAIDAEHHYGSDRKVYVSKVPRKNIIGFGQLEEGEVFYKIEGVTVTELKR